MSDERTALWLYIEERLDGRSWNWLGQELGVTGAGVRSWATGRTTLKGYQADALAVALDVDVNELRAVAGLPPKPGHGQTREAMLAQLNDVAAAVGGFDHYPDEALRQLLAAFEAAKKMGDDASREGLRANLGRP